MNPVEYSPNLRVLCTKINISKLYRYIHNDNEVTSYVDRYRCTDKRVRLYLKGICPNPVYFIVHPLLDAPIINSQDGYYISALHREGYGAISRRHTRPDLPAIVRSLEDIKALYKQLGVVDELPV